VLEMSNPPVEWIPQRPMGRRFEEVPDQISSAASEAFACHSINSNRAAILMARSVIEAVAKDKGFTKGNLLQKIDNLEEANLIHPNIKEMAHGVREFGNDMAHGDFIIPVTEEDAEDVLEFMSLLLSDVYQQPARLERLRSRRIERADRNQATDWPQSPAHSIE
jgi:hypothetical protein